MTHPLRTTPLFFFTLSFILLAFPCLAEKPASQPTQPSQQWVEYPGYDIPGYGRKIVLLAGDQEYRSEETLTKLGRILAQYPGFHCTVLFCQSPENPGVVDPEYARHVPGLEALKTADCFILSTRFLNLPDEQMQIIDDYLRSGRPVLGLRSSNHGFMIPKDDPNQKWAHYDWQYAGPKAAWHGGFGQIIYGGKFIDHHGWKMKESTLGVPAEDKRDHPSLRGLVGDGAAQIWGPTFVYGINTPLRANCDVLMYGQVLDGMEPDSPPLGDGPYKHKPKSLADGAKGKNDPMMPLAWTTEYRLPGGRPGLAFHTTLGASQDFESEGVRKLIVNGVYWLFGIIPPEGGATVDLVGDFETTDYGFHRGDAWQKRGLKIESYNHPIQPKTLPKPDADYNDPKGGRKGKRYADHPVNRFRLYDFYTRQAEAMLNAKNKGELPAILPDYRGLDTGHFGHWGAYHKNSFDDQRHNSAEISTAVAAAFNTGGFRSRQKRSRTIAFQLGPRDGLQLACVFDAEALRMTTVWQGDFVRFHPHRWGLGDGMRPEGYIRLSQSTDKLDGEFLGYYQHGDQNVIHYRLGNTRILEHPTGDSITFVRTFEFPDGVSEETIIPLPTSSNLALRFNHRRDGVEFSLTKDNLVISKARQGGTLTLYTYLDMVVAGNGLKHICTTPTPKPSSLTKGGPDRWTWTFSAPGTPAANRHGAYVHDEIPVPLHNPYGTTVLPGGLSFFDDGRAAISTYIGDVWIVDGLDKDLNNVTWKRFATGLNHALGLEIINGKIIVLGRDRLTRLHDLNEDGMADYYENFSQAFKPSHGGHSFYVGLQKDDDNNLYFTASTHTVKVSADGKTATTLNAGGQRNPNGVGVSPDGIAFTSANEGDWTPASIIWEVQEGDFCGRGAKQKGPPVAPPLAFVPRGIDNSTGDQIWIDDERWGMPAGTMLSTSFGSGTIYGLLRDTHWRDKQKQGGRTQGAVFPIPFDFASGTHRGDFAPHDGQLYLVGADGWGNYAAVDGHFDRVRYTGDPVTYPVAWHAYQNGLTIDLATPLDPASVKAENVLLQQWTYQYSEAYGCRELSVKNPAVGGHDPVALDAISLSKDGKQLRLSIPDLAPVECFHVHARLKTKDGLPFLLDTIHTLLHLDEPHPDLGKTETNDIAADTLDLDIKFVLGGRDLPWTRNRFKEGTSPRHIKIESLAGLKFDKTLITANAGEALQIEFKNIDPLMPHNIVFTKPGTANAVGQASNRLLVEGAAKAAEKHYVPDSEDVLFYSSILVHNRRQLLYVHAPDEPGDYPYLCTFPGHWGVMRGVLRVEE